MRDVENWVRSDGGNGYRTEGTDIGRRKDGYRTLGWAGSMFSGAGKVGLTARRTAGKAMALEITAGLRLLDPADPIKYDFALACLGILGACPSRRDPERCDACPLSPICRV